MNYKAYTVLLLSTIFAFPLNAQTYTTPWYTISFVTTDNTTFQNRGTAVANYQQATQTITVNGTDFSYTTLEKIDPLQDWLIASGGLQD